MRLLDASAVLDLWEIYPKTQFPTFWAWIESEVRLGNLSIPKVALEEVGHKAPACKSVLKGYGITEHSIGNPESVIALAIKTALGIENDMYGGGVDENDIFIISVAKVLGVELITNEDQQVNLPTKLWNYRIPAVCRLPLVKVSTLNTLDYIKRSGMVF